MSDSLAPDLERLKKGARAVARRHDLRLVVVFGSAARHETSEASDLDLGVLGSSGAVDPTALTNAFIRELGVQGIDLVDLRRADPLLLQLAARDGRALFEAEAGEHARFCSLAARRYADTRKFRAMERREIEEWLAGEGAEES